MFSEKDVQRIAVVTNHVSEGMGRFCTRSELYEAVRYWGMEASLLASEAQIAKTRALIDAVLGKLKPTDKPMKLKWKDETTYVQGDKERKPTTWTTEIGGLRITIVSRHIHHPGWVMHCFDIHMDTVPLDVSDLESAKQAAVAKVRERVGAWHKALQSVR